MQYHQCPWYVLPETLQDGDYYTSEMRPFIAWHGRHTGRRCGLRGKRGKMMYQSDSHDFECNIAGHVGQTSALKSRHFRAA